MRLETRAGVDLHVVVLAAGKGTRMKSQRPKVLHRVAGRPMIDYVLTAAAALRPETTTLVVGSQAEEVEAASAHHPGLAFVRQEPQLGTAHALQMAEPFLRHRAGTLLLLYGDVPLLTPRTLQALLDAHAAAGAAMTVLTAVVDRPHGYGRIVRSNGQIARIVEDRDASATERDLHEINSGIYAFALHGLFDAVGRIRAENAQRERYLPDLLEIYRRQGQAVHALEAVNPDEIRGINSRLELAHVSHIVRQHKNDALMTAGVTIEDPATTYVDEHVSVGADTILHPGVSLEGKTTVGTSCEIHSGVRIVDSHLGDRVVVYNHCVIANARIASDAAVGPFAHLRHGAEVREGARVGDFVELKNTVLGPGSKSMHLAYLGDATIGARVNIGAGTITCNYDGVSKHTTVIEDGAFIGSDTQLIAPVTVRQGAYVGSGTTVREDVPAGALAVSAGKQRNIEGWASERKQKEERRKEKGGRRKEKGERKDEAQ